MALTSSWRPRMYGSKMFGNTPATADALIGVGHDRSDRFPQALQRGASLGRNPGEVVVNRGRLRTHQWMTASRRASCTSRSESTHHSRCDAELPLPRLRAIRRAARGGQARPTGTRRSFSEQMPDFASARFARCAGRTSTSRTIGSRSVARYGRTKRARRRAGTSAPSRSRIG